MQRFYDSFFGILFFRHSISVYSSFRIGGKADAMPIIRPFSFPRGYMIDSFKTVYLKYHSANIAFSLMQVPRCCTKKVTSNCQVELGFIGFYSVLFIHIQLFPVVFQFKFSYVIKLSTYFLSFAITSQSYSRLVILGSVRHKSEPCAKGTEATRCNKQRRCRS